MKGVLWWILVSLLGIAIILAAVVSPVEDVFTETYRTSAKFHANEISGIINIMATSDDVTTHYYLLPKIECTVKAERNSINVTILKEEEPVTAIREVVPGAKLKPTTIECSKDARKRITITKEDGKMTITGEPDE